MTRVVLCVLTAVLAVCLTAGSAAAGESAPAKCRPKGAKVLESHGDIAVVRTVDGALASCTPSLPGLGLLALEEEWFPLPAVDLNGRVAGFAILDAVDGLTITAIELGVENGFLHRTYRPPRRVGSLRVRPNGVVAWIACGAKLRIPLDGMKADPRPTCVRPGPSMKRVFVSTPGPTRTRVRMLARSRGIDPRSLRLGGQTLTWRDRGRRRAVRIP
jgi:hypothetical protein